ncbi:hypothetical protein CCACVL1_21324 [Corchorus capsularis]|uniref:Uncharacterized protein n=1 Tax=Corchorus capsularis TaxID=210143 RepID=A0A1R3H6L2_COCAP|nr:hypothetical protein CCACVL1_21324 [Corchorus capsularis]
MSVPNQRNRLKPSELGLDCGFVVQLIPSVITDGSNRGGEGDGIEAVGEDGDEGRVWRRGSEGDEDEGTEGEAVIVFLILKETSAILAYVVARPFKTTNGERRLLK